MSGVHCVIGIVFIMRVNYQQNRIRMKESIEIEGRLVSTARMSFYTNVRERFLKRAFRFRNIQGPGVNFSRIVANFAFQVLFTAPGIL